jgi:hypothetical protein
MTITDNDLDEIIAIQFGNEVMFGKPAIERALEQSKFTTVHSRALFKLMSCMDLGPQWAEYANCPTLFTMSEYNKFIGKKNDQR